MCCRCIFQCGGSLDGLLMKLLICMWSECRGAEGDQLGTRESQRGICHQTTPVQREVRQGKNWEGRHWITLCVCPCILSSGSGVCIWSHQSTLFPSHRGGCGPSTRTQGAGTRHSAWNRGTAVLAGMLSEAHLNNREEEYGNYDISVCVHSHKHLLTLYIRVCMYLFI